MNSFRVGMKVVVVKNDLSNDERASAERARKSGVTFPVAGVVYTIRDLVDVHRVDGTSVLCLRLIEIRNDPAMRFSNGEIGEICFQSRCFRPVVERGTDAGMSILRELLNKQDKTVREDA